MKPQYQVERGEKRVPMAVTLLLAGNHGMMGVERTLTENVSFRGARVVSTRCWLPDETLLVASPDFHFTSAARVAYCTPLGEGRFGTGLEFLEPSTNWVTGAPAKPQD